MRRRVTPIRWLLPQRWPQAAVSIRRCFALRSFVLAIFVGYYVVWAVTPALHTPLMSVTNAISSVIVVGALLAVGMPAAAAMTDSGAGWGAQVFGFLALVMASVNIFGGFLVTQRHARHVQEEGLTG